MWRFYGREALGLPARFNGKATLSRPLGKDTRMPVAVNEGTFEQEVLKSEKPVIVDFWAEWCGPCHAIAPVLDKIVEDRSDEVRLVKVNIDEEQGLAMRYGIQSI